MNDINLIISAKLTCPCNTLRTSHSFARSDSGVVIDSEPHLIVGRLCEKIVHFFYKSMKLGFKARLVINKIFEGQCHARNSP